MYVCMYVCVYIYIYILSVSSFAIFGYFISSSVND